MADLIDRQELRKAMYHEAFETDSDEQMWDSGCWIRYKMFERILDSMPSAQPEPLSDAYTKAVWTWLLEYQIKASELKGRYTPYEVLSWVANDWRKEHERSD